MTSNLAFTEKNIQKPDAYLLDSRPERKSLVPGFGHVSHSTELVRMCLACQHFDFNSADWISDNLHVITSWYLRTMGKDFILQFSRRLWGRNAWRTPNNICVGGYPPTPLPYANISAYFLLRAKWWLRGRVGVQFPRNLNWSIFVPNIQFILNLLLFIV